MTPPHLQSIMSTPNHRRPMSANMPVARLFSMMPNSPSMPRLGGTPPTAAPQQTPIAPSPKLLPIPRELTPESKDAAMAASIRQSIIDRDEDYTQDLNYFMQKRLRYQRGRKRLTRDLNAVNIKVPAVQCGSCMEFCFVNFTISQRCGHVSCRSCHERYYASSAVQNRSRPRCGFCGVFGFHGLDVDIEKFEIDDLGGIKCYHCRRLVVNEKMRGSYCCKVVMCSDCVSSADTDNEDGGLDDTEEEIENRLKLKGKEGTYRPLIQCPSCFEVGPRFWLHFTTGQVRGLGQHVSIPEVPGGKLSAASMMPHTA